MASVISGRVKCWVTAAATCAGSMIVCHWILGGPMQVASLATSERDRIGVELNRTQQLLTMTQGQLWALQSAPIQCPDVPQPTRIRYTRRPTPVFAPEWTIR